MREENPVAAISYAMTPETIAAYLQEEQNRGASENALRRCRRVTSFLYEWLSVRTEAERKLKEDPRSFIDEQGLKKELCV